VDCIVEDVFATTLGLTNATDALAARHVSFSSSIPTAVSDMEKREALCMDDYLRSMEKKGKMMVNLLAEAESKLKQDELKIAGDRVKYSVSLAALKHAQAKLCGVKAVHRNAYVAAVAAEVDVQAYNDEDDDENSAQSEPPYC
jgi:hypothetical protein